MRPTGLEFLEVGGHQLHFRLIHPEWNSVPILFLHEGLGCVELWRNFPDEVATKTRHPVLVFARYGNGWSDPLTGMRSVDYMHKEALTVLPEIVDTRLSRPPIIIGHSDGASIALIYAGAGHPVEGLVLLAPHVFVEEEGLRAISAIRDEFVEGSELAAKMRKYHTEPERTFRGWSDIWLNPDFRSWNIEAYLPGVHSPTLLIQGDADQYGTVRQLQAIEAGISAPTKRLEVAGAEHSPHLSHPELVTDEVVSFIGQLS